MNIFSFNEYRPLLKQLLLEKKAQLGTQFTFQRMADFCRIQKTYLSKVMADGAHLSEDQLFLAFQFLGLNQNEQDYVFSLYNYERSSIKARKDALSKKLNEYKHLHKKTEAHLDTNLGSEELNVYYLNPDLQILHMLLTIEKFAKNTSLLKNVLGFSDEKIFSLLKTLKELKIIQDASGKIEVLQDNLHLASSSPLYKAYRTLWKNKSLERLNNLESNAYSFSATISTSKEVHDKIQNEILNLIKKAQKLTSESNEEEVYQFNIDLFPWSHN